MPEQNENQLTTPTSVPRWGVCVRLFFRGLSVLYHLFRLIILNLLDHLSLLDHLICDLVYEPVRSFKRNNLP